VSAHRAGASLKVFLATVGLAVVLAMAVSSVSDLTMVGIVKQHARNAPVPNLKDETAPERIAPGKAVVDGYCSACHSKTGSLTGGEKCRRSFPDAHWVQWCLQTAPRWALRRWSDGEIFRAIRNDVDADGHWLTIMSYTNVSKLGDDDIQATIAHISSVPAGEATPDPSDQLNLLGVAIVGCGHAAARPSPAVSRRRQRAALSIWRIYPVVSGLSRMP
jgi:hypothetical protein